MSLSAADFRASPSGKVCSSRFIRPSAGSPMLLSPMKTPKGSGQLGPPEVVSRLPNVKSGLKVNSEDANAERALDKGDEVVASDVVVKILSTVSLMRMAELPAFLLTAKVPNIIQLWRIGQNACNSSSTSCVSCRQTAPASSHSFFMYLRFVPRIR